MTREELKVKCLALAQAGDAAAAATLELFREVEMFRGVRVNGQVIDGIVPREHISVPPNVAAAASRGLREPKSVQEPSADEVERIKAIARQYGIDSGGTEASAVAATRIANGLPSIPEPEVTAINPETKMGGFEKIPGGAKAEGNKE